MYHQPPNSHLSKPNKNSRSFITRLAGEITSHISWSAGNVKHNMLGNGKPLST